MSNSLSDLLSQLPVTDLAEIISGIDGWEDVANTYTEPDIEYPQGSLEFINDVLGYTLWGMQEAVARAVENHPRVVVEAGHSVGKSILAAALANWWLSVNEKAKVITLAPVWSQVESIIWPYMRSMKEGAKLPLPGQILETPRWKVSADRFGIGLSPRKSSREDLASLQGYHSPKLLVILDEIGGLNREVVETVNSLASATDNRVLAIGNPVGKSGIFYDLTQSPSWKHIRISCLDHPNITEGKDIIPGAVSQQWVEQMVTDHCMQA